MPTALELTHEQWQPYIEAARQRLELPELTPAERHQRERLLLRVRQVATELKFQFKVKRVILFGSLAHADWFAPDSDVDLAVEGLRAKDYWQDAPLKTCPKSELHASIKFLWKSNGYRGIIIISDIGIYK